MKKLSPKTKHYVLEPAIVGSTVVIGAPIVGGILNSVLAFIPSFTVGGLSVPHGIIAAGIAAIAGNAIANFASKKL